MNEIVLSQPCRTGQLHIPLHKWHGVAQVAAVSTLDSICQAVASQILTPHGGRIYGVVLPDPQAVCDAVKADVDAIADEAEQFDDITMLCISYAGEQPAISEETV